MWKEYQSKQKAVSLVWSNTKTTRYEMRTIRSLPPKKSCPKFRSFPKRERERERRKIKRNDCNKRTKFCTQKWVWLIIILVVLFCIIKCSAGSLVGFCYVCCSYTTHTIFPHDAQLAYIPFCGFRRRTNVSLNMFSFLKWRRKKVIVEWKITHNFIIIFFSFKKVAHS